MLYITPYRNIKHILESVGYIHMEQVLRIFSDVSIVSALDLYNGIGELVGTRDLRWWHDDPGSCVLMCRQDPDWADREVEKLLRALWVLTLLKSKQIGDVFLREHPHITQFCFSRLPAETEGDAAAEGEEIYYDVTVCGDIQTVQAAYRIWNDELPYGAKDTVKHLALVSDRGFGETLREYNFSGYCMLCGENYPEVKLWD